LHYSILLEALSNFALPWNSAHDKNDMTRSPSIINDRQWEASSETSSKAALTVNGKDSPDRRKKNKISRFSMTPESGLSGAMISLSISSLSGLA